MGNKIDLPVNDEFSRLYSQFVLKEREIRLIINDLDKLAATLRLESYNNKYEKIKTIDNEIKFLYYQMEKKAADKMNSQNDALKKQLLVEVKKRYMSLIEDYMKIPMRIFSTIKLEIK
jgi:hypothetical protein